MFLFFTQDFVMPDIAITRIGNARSDDDPPNAMLLTILVSQKNAKNTK